MLIRRDAFLDAGGFDAAYFAYYEDVDLGWRLWSGGQRVLFAPARRRPPPLGRDQQLLGLYQPRLPLRAQRLPHRLQELRGGPVGAGDAGGAAGADVAHPDAARRGQSGREPARRRPVRRPHRGHGAPAPGAAGRPPARGAGRLLRRVLGRVRRAVLAPRITDRRTVAQFRAQAFLLRHLDAAAAKRAAVQARRRRSDREILERFPPYLRRDLSGRRRTVRERGLPELAPSDLRLVECALADVMEVG